MSSSDEFKAPENKHEVSDTATQLLQRWRRHCEGARVYVQVAKASETSSHASSSAPSSTTLFRQETQFYHISATNREDGAGTIVVLEAQFDLKIRHEFWDRPVLLNVHITPELGVIRVVHGISTPESVKLKLKESMTASLLSDDWAISQLLSLTREENQPPPLTTRRVEQRIVVTKPLQLEVESRELAGQRVGILTRASNTHSTLALALRDLHLQLDQSLRAQDALSRETCRYRIVSDDKVPFPVVLQPQERYNFLFVLEPVEVMAPNEALGRPGADKKQATTSSTRQKNTKASAALRLTACSQQHTMLTLSWYALDVSMDVITETRTIVWSPKAPSPSFSSRSNGETELQTDIRHFVTCVLDGHLTRRVKPNADFKCVRLVPDSVLQATVAPLASSVQIGDAVTVCVTVLNRSVCVDFDLALVLPAQTRDGNWRHDGDAAAVVGFEASLRLGLVRPGMSVSRSLHVAFLRSGKCRLGPLVLVDCLTRTCFVSDDWKVFVKN